jgi:hypothetical protein
MKQLLTIFLGLLVSGLFAQQRAVTDTGEEVILFTDGTWVYVEDHTTLADEIRENPRRYTRSNDATFLLKSSRVNHGVYLDTKLWSFTKSVDNADAEYELQLKGEDLYGMLITERIEIPLETLREVAVQNGRAVAPDLRIVDEEFRTVNGQRVLMMQMDGTLEGIKFSYFGYYCSGESGTVQFITYTSQNLLNSYRSTCEALLNGFVGL